ncbi:helix-turn-helix domain-containing protein [Microbacterium lushaniae]|nr:helix-turn-helix domain-containing protein [Microbacterium lushaniae]KAA9155076.1 helix-turn-helix domain-containing protein [Microbacterium lushaniae]
MAMHAHPNAYVSGTTRGLPSGRDYDHFCDSVADVYVGVRPRRPDQGPFAADFALYDLAPFTLGWVETPGVSAHRDRASLRNVADDAVFVNYSEGRWGLAQRGRSWDATGRTALLLDNASPFTVTADPSRPLRLASLRIPRTSLSPRTANALEWLDDRLAGTVHGAQLGAQMSLLTDVATRGMPSVARAMASSIVEMLDAFAGVEPRVPSRFENMTLYASTRLHDPALDLRDMARALRCSTRTVQTAFATEGTTFSAWVRAARLDRARAALRSQDAAQRPLAAIAREHGFSDVGTFHRAYRSRFGRTPASDR